MKRRLYGFIEGGSGAVGCGAEGGAIGSVPGESKAVDIEETIAGSNLLFGGYIGERMGEQFGKVMLVDLLGKGVCLRYGSVMCVGVL